MKVVPVRGLDSHDRKRFSDLSPRVDADAVREQDWLAMAFNQAFVRATWRRQRSSRKRAVRPK